MPDPGLVSSRGDDSARLARRVAFGGFAAIAGYFLWTEHRAHVIQLLPWALLALCPLLHIFMHRRHGHDGSHGPGSDRGGE